MQASEESLDLVFSVLINAVGGVFHPGNIKVFMQSGITSAIEVSHSSHGARMTGSIGKSKGEPPLPIRQRFEPTANILPESPAVSE